MIKSATHTIVGMIHASMMPQNTVMDYPLPGATVIVLAYIRK